MVSRKELEMTTLYQVTIQAEVKFKGDTFANLVTTHTHIVGGDRAHAISKAKSIFTSTFNVIGLTKASAKAITLNNPMIMATEIVT